MKQSEIIKIDEIIEGTIFKNGKTYDEIGITVKTEENEVIYINRGAYTVLEDNIGKYVDFTKTRYKDLGILRIKNMKGGDY